MLRQISQSVSLQQIYADAIDWCNKMAAEHMEMQRHLWQTTLWTANAEEIRKGLLEKHNELATQYWKLAGCFSHFDIQTCKEEIFPKIDDLTQQLNCFRSRLKCLHSHHYSEYSALGKILSGWMDSEQRFADSFQELVQWFSGVDESRMKQLALQPEALSRDTGTICTVPSPDFMCQAENMTEVGLLPAVDLTTMCPANLEVDDVFYDCPTDTGRELDAPQLQLTLTQTISSSFMQSAKATFIIDMIGYLSKKGGCNDEQANILRTATGVAIAFYSGSFISSLTYLSTKRLAELAGCSEANASRLALAAQTGVIVARNLTPAGLAETGVSMASAYTGSFAGSFVSLFTQIAADTAYTTAREKLAIAFTPVASPNRGRCY